MQLNWKLRLLAFRVDNINIFRHGHLTTVGLDISKLSLFEKKIC